MNYWNNIKLVLPDYLLKLLLIVVILALSSLLINFIKKTTDKLLQRANIEPAIASLLSDLLKFILWILSFTAILSILGLNEVALALGGSIVLMGLGLAKSIASVAGDLIAGIFLIIDEDFKVGYRIQVSGIEGIIESLEIRKTKIRDDNNHLHIIANKRIDAGVIIISK